MPCVFVRFASHGYKTLMSVASKSVCLVQCALMNVRWCALGEGEFIMYGRCCHENERAAALIGKLLYAWRHLPHPAAMRVLIVTCGNQLQHVRIIPTHPVVCAERYFHRSSGNAVHWLSQLKYSTRATHLSRRPLDRWRRTSIWTTPTRSESPP